MSAPSPSWTLEKSIHWLIMGMMSRMGFLGLIMESIRFPLVFVSPSITT
jgi:hypothetical protein